MSRTWKLILGGIAWGLAAYAALYVANLPGDYTHEVCGPWGCYPPLQALTAMHLFWVVVLLPFVGLGLGLARPRRLQRAGLLLFIGTLFGMLIVAGRDLLAWLSSVPPEFQVYWPRRVLYTLVTMSDIPFLQLLLVGAICWSVGKVRGRLAACPPVRHQVSQLPSVPPA